MKEYPNEYADFFYYTPTYIEKNFNLFLVRAGRNLAKQNYIVGPKRIECYSMHFVREGVLQVECNGKSETLEKGDLFVMFPGRSYIYRTCGVEPPLQLNWVAINGIDAESLLEHIGVSPEHFVRMRALNAKLELALDLMFDRLSQYALPDIHHSLELQSLLYAIFSQLTLSSVDAVNAAAPSHWIRKAVDYMDRHYMEGILVEQVAELVGINRSYFSSAFTELIGCSPKQYIQQLRIDKGKSLLQETDMSVTEVGMSLGYPSLYAFTRAFKTAVGFSPQQYRATLQS